MIRGACTITDDGDGRGTDRRRPPSAAPDLRLRQGALISRRQRAGAAGRDVRDRSGTASTRSPGAWPSAHAADARGRTRGTRSLIVRWLMLADDRRGARARCCCTAASAPHGAKTNTGPLRRRARGDHRGAADLPRADRPAVRQARWSTRSSGADIGVLRRGRDRARRLRVDARGAGRAARARVHGSRAPQADGVAAARRR